MNTKKLKPGLVAFYDIRPGNGPILKGREEISKEKVKKKGLSGGSIRYKQAKRDRLEVISTSSDAVCDSALC